MVLVVLVTNPFEGALNSAVAQSSGQLGDGDLNCGNFLTEEDAQVVFLASDTPDDPDPYGLDGVPGPTPGGIPQVGCDNADIGGLAPASCANFLPASEGGQRHAQALYEVTNGGQGYNLVAVNGQACVAGVPSDRPTEPTPQAPAAPVPQAPVATGCDVQVRNGRAYVNTDCANGTVRVGFEEFEGFDAFAARAQNGFGIFDESASGTASLPSIQVQQPARNTTSGTGAGSSDTTESGSRLVESEQTARQKARAKKKRKAKRARLRQAERARLREVKQQNEIRSEGGSR